MTVPIYARTARELKVRFSAGQTGYFVTLPEGLRCARISEGSTRGKYWLDEFPESIFPRGSLMRHDAVHYGIVLEPEDVTVGGPPPQGDRSR